MSSGRFCVIRDLGPVKGGKGLKHHEVVLELSWRGLLRFAAPEIGTTPTNDAAIGNQRALPGGLFAAERVISTD